MIYNTGLQYYINSISLYYDNFVMKKHLNAAFKPTLQTYPIPRHIPMEPVYGSTNPGTALHLE